MEGAGEPRTGKEGTTEAPTFPVPWGLAPVAAALAPSVHSWLQLEIETQRPGGNGAGQCGPKQTLWKSSS